MNSKLDILFVTPPSRLEVYQDLSNEYAAIEPPVWSSLIAKYMMIRNYNVKILDAEAEQLTHEQTAKKIVDQNPLLVVFMVYGQQPSASTQCMPAGRKTANIMNQLSSNEMKSIVIGTHASALPKRTLQEEAYTYVCQGEGPKTIEGLVKHLKNEKIKLSDIRGLWYYEDNEIKKNKPAEMFTDLDKDLPGQSWELLDMRK